VSYSIDANILLYASDETSPHCGTAKRFLSDCASRSEPFCLCWPVVMAYLRIATHPRIFDSPLSPIIAMANIERLLSLPQIRLLAEGSRFWECYREVAAPLTLRGNLVPDAHIAALLLEHGVPTLFTHDRDFLKFEHLTVRDPVS